MNYFIQPKALVFIALIVVAYLEMIYINFKDVRARLMGLIHTRVLLLQTAFLFLAVGCTFFLDTPVLAFIHSLEHSIFAQLEAVGGALGRNINPWLSVSAIYFLSLILKRNAWHRAAFGALLAALITAMICYLLKHLALRARPDAGLGPFSFMNWSAFMEDGGDFQSFPSGDVAVVAGLACYFFHALKQFSARYGMLILPLLTAFSRISLNRHWPSDTLFSIVLGLIVAWYVLKYQDRIPAHARAAL